MGRNDCIGGGLFVCLGIFIWIYTMQFPVIMDAGGGRHPGPALFPRIIATLFIFFGLLVILNGWRVRRSETSSGEERGAGLKPLYFNPVLVIILIAAFVVLTPKLGFLITGTASLTILMVKLRASPPKSLLISSLVSCFIYFVFVTVLSVPLPRGLLGW